MAMRGRRTHPERKPQMERVERILVAFADDGAWRLYRRLAKQTNGWHNFHLEGPSSRPEKRNWRLGHNGERFAHNRDVYLLREHEPGVYAWAETECSKACKG
jgi:hypothetical protein